MDWDRRNRYIQNLVEQEKTQATRDAERECQRIVADAASRGVAQSGMVISLRMQAWLQAGERILKQRLSAEEEVLSREREAAPAEWREKLADDVRAILIQIRQQLERETAHDAYSILGARDASPVLASLDPEMIRLEQQYIREVEVLHGRFTLDSEARAREAKIARGNITINIHHGTVGTLNLGTVIGDIQSHLSTLKADGHDQIVEALKRLAEEIGDSEELGDGRREALEQVALITAEAERVPAERRLGVVKSMLTTLQATLATSASLIKVWEFACPYIKSYFNLDDLVKRRGGRWSSPIRIGCSLRQSI